MSAGGRSAAGFPENVLSGKVAKRRRNRWFASATAIPKSQSKREPSVTSTTSDLSSNQAPPDHDDIMYPSAIPFIIVHLVCFAAIWTGITWQSVAICITLYWLRIFGIGAGYHRYFSHRAYSTSRVFQFILALLSQSTTQKSVLWWASKHRHHHLHSDTEVDVHSPRHKGFLYSHFGWIFDRRHNDTDLVKIADFAAYPELMWLHHHELVPAITLGVICFLIGGWPGLVVGFFWSTVLVYHATFCINSLAHVHGRKRYVTGDDSRNNWFLALFTMGEGWHNNHHAYQSSARQGFRWWEYDPTFYILTALSWVGIVWDLKSPPAIVVRNEQRLGSRVIERAAAQLAASFNSERIAEAMRSALDRSHISALQETLAATQQRATHLLESRASYLRDALPQLPHLPSREDILARARATFAKTPSMEDIADRAHTLLLEAIAARLTGALSAAKV
jgi:stearoyl-CoA desaturase (Delta-9 desaturase)